MTSWRRSSPKLRSARDEIPGRCAEAKSSSGTALRRLRNCPRTRTHFDGATKSGWHSNSANDAEPFYPKSIDPAHHLLAIRHLACGFPGSVSQKLTHQLSAFLPNSQLIRLSSGLRPPWLAVALRAGGCPLPSFDVGRWTFSASPSSVLPGPAAEFAAPSDFSSQLFRVSTVRRARTLRREAVS